MEIHINHNSYFIFDLDDTLTDELDFVHSAFNHLSYQIHSVTGEHAYDDMLALFSANKNVFEWLTLQYGDSVPGLSVKRLLKEYREHIPKISLRKDASVFLEKLCDAGVPCGLVTDGRSVTQRNKLKALQLESYFDDVIISEEFGSEKPDPSNYLYFMHKYPGRDFYFFGDNTVKDFLVPLQLGWQCFCLKDRGKNIHKQMFEGNTRWLHIIESFDEVEVVSRESSIVNRES